MKLNLNYSTFRVYTLLIVFPVLFYSCDKNDDEEGNTNEKLLSGYNWHESITQTDWAGSDLVDPINITDNHEESCEQDDYRKFDMNDYTYEINLGSNKCEVDEPQIDDWGTWEIDDSKESSEYLLLKTYSDNPDNIIPDIVYEILELTSNRMVLRLGGCVDNTFPDEDGLCVTMTFEPL